jgi:hypothetical protein
MLTWVKLQGNDVSVGLINIFILQSFYLSSQNALTVYLQVINGYWPFITFRPRLLDLIDGTTFLSNATFEIQRYLCDVINTFHFPVFKKKETTALLAKGNTNASQMYSRVLTVTIRAHLFPIQTTTPASTNVSRGIAASTGADINLPEHPSICSQKEHLEQDILHALRSQSSCKLHECVHVRPPLTIFVFTSHEMSIEMNNLIDFNPRTKFWYLFSCHLYFIVKKCLFSKILSEYQWYIYLCIDLWKVEFSV